MNFVAESVHVIISHHKVSRSFMSNQLRLLLMMFYAPARALSEVRERAPLALALLFALAAESLYGLYTQWPFLSGGVLSGRTALVVFAVVLQTAMMLLLTALVFVPIIIFVAHAFERRASFRVALQQEYASVASVVFYALAAANLLTLPFALLARTLHLDAGFARWYLQLLAQAQRDTPDSPLLMNSARLADPQLLSANFFQLLLFPFLILMLTIGVREVFRSSTVRAWLIVMLGGLLFFIAVGVLTTTVFGFILTSPFLLLILFFVLRGYFGDIMATQRARASFKQNLEAATLNPADASAHYNLALIHQQRGELEAARERFQKAVDIDADETDSHYQLGRIARAQNKWPEAIEHFSKVVENDETHAQHEIWREIGATYLAAGQFEDARDALEKFLARRTSDPEALYLMGRAHAGLGHQREAKSAMQACIEAVKSAPAYKYRAEKRWLNEALAFLRSQA